MASFQFLWVIRVYIVLVKDKKVTLKNPSDRMFHEYLVRRPYMRDTHEILQADMTLQFLACASHVAFRRLSTREPVTSCSVLHSSSPMSHTQHLR